MLPGTWGEKLSFTIVSNWLHSVLWPDCFGDIFWEPAFKNRQLGKWQCSRWEMIKNWTGLEDLGWALRNRAWGESLRRHLWKRDLSDRLGEREELRNASRIGALSNWVHHRRVFQRRTCKDWLVSSSICSEVTIGASFVGLVLISTHPQTLPAKTPSEVEDWVGLLSLRKSMSSSCHAPDPITILSYLSTPNPLFFSLCLPQASLWHANTKKR